MEDLGMSIPKRHPDMRHVALIHAREELLCLRPLGAKGGETKQDEIEAVGLVSASMLVTFALLNKCKSRGDVSPTTTGR